MMHTSSDSKTQNAFLRVSVSSFAALFAAGCSKDSSSTPATKVPVVKVPVVKVPVVKVPVKVPVVKVPVKDNQYTLYYHEDFAARVRPLQAMLEQAKAHYTREDRPELIDKKMEHIFAVPALQISLKENKDSKSDKTKPKPDKKEFTSQTIAIAMQLGDELGFAPEEDKKYAALKVALDIQDALSEASAKRTEDPNSWVEVQKWLDTRFVAWAKSLEASHELYGGEYMMGDKMTYVDFLLMSLFDCGINAFGGDRFKKAGEVAPKVFAIATKMLEVDSVAQLIKEQPALPKKAQSDGEMPVVGDLVAKKGM